MKDMFEVQNAKDVTQAMGVAKQQELENSQAAAVLKEEVAKEIEADPVERGAGCFIREDGRGSGHSGADVPSPAWKKYREILEFADTEKSIPRTKLISCRWQSTR